MLPRPRSSAPKYRATGMDAMSAAHRSTPRSCRLERGGRAPTVCGATAWTRAHTPSARRTGRLRAAVAGWSEGETQSVGVMVRTHAACLPACAPKSMCKQLARRIAPRIVDCSEQRAPSQLVTHLGEPSLQQTAECGRRRDDPGWMVAWMHASQGGVASQGTRELLLLLRPVRLPAPLKRCNNLERFPYETWSWLSRQHTATAAPKMDDSYASSRSTQPSGLAPLRAVSSLM